MSDKPKISVITLGCKVNRYDSDAMCAVFAENGFETVSGLEPAEVYVVNTCAVTAEAERKSRQTLSKILKLNPDAHIYVCGCASQNDFSQFARDNVEFVSGTEGKTALAAKIALRYNGDAPQDIFEKIIPSDFSISDDFEESGGVLTSLTRHYIKIQDGCNNFCSYCIVPYLRGRSRSRSLSSILRELNDASLTAKEVVITGINLSAYGLDIGASLTQLLVALQNYDFRFRLGSLEVGAIDDGFLMAAGSLKAFCPHFHLSLQSGDDGILNAMNRRYSTEQFASAVTLIRNYFSDAAITTDIIVGYPTESEQAFSNSMAFARLIGFSDIHVFPYSSRKGTVAGRLPVLPKEIVADRERRMLEVKSELRNEFLLSRIGKTSEVLFETKEDGMWCGHTRDYVKVYSIYGARNTLIDVKPTALYSDGMRV